MVQLRRLKGRTWRGGSSSGRKEGGGETRKETFHPVQNCKTAATIQKKRNLKISSSPLFFKHRGLSSTQQGYKPIIESSKSISLSSSANTLSYKFAKLPKKPFNMSTTVVSSVSLQPEPATKIEKLEAKLASFEESFEKEEKLRAKLRYLQFFENFHISPAPASFVCSQCKEVEVVQKEVLNHPCPNSKKGSPAHVTTNYKKGVEVQCMDQETHKREWQEQGKSRQEVRQEIRREFNKQEQGGRGRRGQQERSKDLVKLHQADFNLNPPRAEKAPASVLPPPAKEQGKEQNKEQEQEKENVGKLLHGDSCKTCVRMNKLTGQVLPHSPNY